MDTESPVVAAEGWSGKAATVLPIDRGVATVSPTAERRAAPVEKQNDGGLSVRIPLRDIMQILGAVLAIAAIVWTLRSDIRDIKTSMEYQNKIQEERSATLQKSIESLQRRQELQSFEMQEMKLSLARAGIGTIEINGDGKP